MCSVDTEVAYKTLVHMLTNVISLDIGKKLCAAIVEYWAERDFSTSQMTLIIQSLTHLLFLYSTKAQVFLSAERIISLISSTDPRATKLIALLVAHKSIQLHPLQQHLKQILVNLQQHPTVEAYDAAIFLFSLIADIPEKEYIEFLKGHEIHIYGISQLAIDRIPELRENATQLQKKYRVTNL